jgi:hypothetical protein
MFKEYALYLRVGERRREAGSQPDFTDFVLQ